MTHTPIRRVVTGHTADNFATVIVDGDAKNVRGNRPGQYTTLM